jgi:hypothetical protein
VFCGGGFSMARPATCGSVAGLVGVLVGAWWLVFL